MAFAAALVGEFFSVSFRRTNLIFIEVVMSKNFFLIVVAGNRSGGFDLIPSSVSIWALYGLSLHQTTFERLFHSNLQIITGYKFEIDLVCAALNYEVPLSLSASSKQFPYESTKTHRARLLLLCVSSFDTLQYNRLRQSRHSRSGENIGIMHFHFCRERLVGRKVLRWNCWLCQSIFSVRYPVSQSRKAGKFNQTKWRKWRAKHSRSIDRRDCYTRWIFRWICYSIDFWLACG